MRDRGIFTGLCPLCGADVGPRGLYCHLHSWAGPRTLTIAKTGELPPPAKKSEVTPLKQAKRPKNRAANRQPIRLPARLTSVLISDRNGGQNGVD
jgi:hypothetical protein